MSGGDDHPAPADDRPGGAPAVVEVDPWTTRCEVLAVLAVLGVVGSIAQNVLQGLHLAGSSETLGFSWSSFTASVAVTAIGPGPALLLALALALVVLSPGPSIGGLGSGVLQAVAVLGVIVATTALIGIVETLRFDEHASNPAMFVITGSSGLQRAAVIATFVPTGGLAAGAALFAWRTLAEVAPVSR